MATLKRLVIIFSLVLLIYQLNAQGVQITKEQLIALTPEWKGERFPDGRPKVPDDIIRRMKAVSVEEAWATMSNAGYRYQIAEGWEVINPDSVLVGRAVTTTFMPGRPDVWKAIDSGKISRQLVDAACDSIKGKATGNMREIVKTPYAVLVNYNDGTKGAILMLNEYVNSGWAYAARANGKTVATEFVLDDSMTVGERIKEQVAKSGENVRVSQFKRIELGVTE